MTADDDEIRFPCPYCDAQVRYPDGEHDCTREPVSVDGTCPVCGDEYDDWLGHITDACPGAGSG